MSTQHKNECRFIGVIKPNSRYTEGFELKFTAGGTAVLTINLCVTEEFKGKEGDARYKSTYIPVRAWGEKAEAWAKSLNLYSVIDILTCFRTSSYTTAGGEKRYEHKFDVLALKVLEQGSAQDADPAPTSPVKPPTVAPAVTKSVAPRPTVATPAPAPTPAPVATTAKKAAAPAVAPAPAPKTSDDDIPF